EDTARLQVFPTLDSALSAQHATPASFKPSTTEIARELCSAREPAHQRKSAPHEPARRYSIRSSD
ncbi:MAG TPA: hypothetical protein PJ982_10615, partial [Lacipirellulaceae bacterium]|nr:hypothetical protein [Lacipirellulaceae bacterium]